MARKKRSSLAKLSKNVASRKRRKRQNAALTHNPKSSVAKASEDIGGFVTATVIPGVAGYAASRLAGRIAYAWGKKRSARFAKHAGALAPSAAAAGIWYGTSKVEALNEYHVAATIGATIGAFQAIVQTYIPRWGWVLNDYHLDDVLPMAAAQAQPAMASAPAPRPGAPAQQEPSAPPIDDDFSDIPGMTDDIYAGNFSGGMAN